MKKLLLNLLFLALLPAAAHAQATLMLDSTKLDIQVIIDSPALASPWDIEIAPDGRLWYTDSRSIYAFDPLSKKKAKQLVRMSRGYGLGLAMPSLWPKTGPSYVFAVFDTAAYYGSGRICELFRFEYDAGLDSLVNPVKLLSYPHTGEHAGGRITLTEDNKILLTTADYWIDGYDTIGHKKGKVLRINFDGSMPPDNARADYTWTYGHRNPQGIVRLPNNNIFLSEHGQSRNEINFIKKGKNYGWPVFDATTCYTVAPDSCTSATFLAHYQAPQIDPGYPPAGLDYYDHPAIPEFRHALVVGLLGFGVGSQRIGVLKLDADADSIIAYKNYNTAFFGRTRDVEVAPDGSVYFLVRDRNDPYIVRAVNPKYSNVSDPKATGQDIVVYPNPVQDKLWLKNLDRNAVYTLSDVSGRILQQGEIPAREALDVSSLSSGIYLLDIEGKVLKFQVQR